MRKAPALAAACALLALTACSGKRPKNLGVLDGHVQTCPAENGCISTGSEDPRHHVDPIPFKGDPAWVAARLIQIISAMPRTELLAHQRAENTESVYLRVEFTSALFRFVDDVEFYVDQPRKQIHFRAAARRGYADMGGNRRRIEEIRQQLGADI